MSALAPDPDRSPFGKWTVVAVDGESTGGGERFNFSIEQPYGSAQFGCNKGGGRLRVERGWLVTGDWIVTTAGCVPAERMRFERRGFDITSQPMAISARSPGGIRLHNRVGSIELIPTRTVKLNLVGKWNVAAINGRATPDGPAAYSMDFEAMRIGARFGCNIIGGEYRLSGGVLTTNALVMTEMACGEPASGFEAQGSAILQQRMYLAEANGRLTLSNPAGTIVLLRQR